ncbi:3616_t:CDS:2 [Acaulospora colombiana]|uniref:3616_t:CDS:1 n=1 Tax=Acaulospora colombiana TaxID=27376 RepID=A0ACA9M1S0_9GLOM|nr:3616_t:CDS:2 [Acaulospora colombiana]
MTGATEENVEIEIEQKNDSITSRESINHPAVLLIGLQGAGKSMLGNMLLGGYTINPEAKKFEVYDGSYEENVHRPMDIRTAEIEINNNKFTLVDTPGIIVTETHTRRSWSEILNAIEKAKKKSGTRLTAADKTHIEEVIRILGTDRLIIVFTKRRKDVTINKEKMEDMFNEELRSILKLINNRWVVAPDLDIFGRSDEGKKDIEKNMNELKRLISEMEVPKKRATGFHELIINNWKVIVVSMSVITVILIAISVVYAENSKHSTI